MRRLVTSTLVILFLLFGHWHAHAQQQTSIVINGTEQFGDTGTLTLTVKTPTNNDYVATIPYGQYSTGAGIASAFGGLLSQDPNSPVNAQAFGNTLKLLARSSKGGMLTSVSFTASGQQNSFQNVSAVPSGPTITGLSLSEGPPQMGFVITGSGFGATQGSGVVTIGGVAATVVPGTWSDRSITVQVPNAAPSQTQIIVSFGNGSPFIQSNAWPFQIDQPFACPIQ